MVQDLLRAEQRRARDRRRRQHAGDPGEGQDVLRRHPPGPARRPLRPVGRQAQRDRAAVRAGPRPADAHHEDRGTSRATRRGTACCSTSPAQVLSTGKSSRLYKRLVYDDQIATRGGRVQRHARDREPLHDRGRRQEGRRSRQGRARDRRGAGEVPGERPDRKTSSIARRPTSFSGFIRGVERIGGFGGKSDVLAASMVYGGPPRRLQGRPRHHHATRRRRRSRKPRRGG